MTPAARISAAIEVLDRVFGGDAGEQALTHWARQSRFAGSKDRAAVRDLVFDALRCQRSFAALGGSMTGRGVMLGAVRAMGLDTATLFNGVGHAPAPVGDHEVGRQPEPGAESLDCPDWLWPIFNAALPDAPAALRALQSRAPVFCRVALRRTNRASVIESLAADQIVAIAHPKVPTAIEIVENARKVTQSAAFLSGHIEMQDASSQAAILRLPVVSRALDFCAGGGGKALALADRGTSVHAHDIDPKRMRDIPVRAARAGVSIPCLTGAQVQTAKPFDLVLCDAPCSGSGTWRRAPEAKWRLTPARLAELTTIQDKVLAQAQLHVKPGGLIAYATCSVFPVENQDRVAVFLARNSNFHAIDQWSTPPNSLGDGFFISVLQKNTVQP